MNKISPKPAPSVAGDESTLPPQTLAPVTFLAVGRQRVGKTTLLNGLAQAVQVRGGDPEIWNADLLNKSHSIASFHPQTLSPGHAQTTEQRACGSKTGS